MDMDNIDKTIINRLQDGFPICEHPFAQVAKEFNISEDECIERLQTLLDNKLLSRFGPMYHAEKMGGALSLVAMHIPDDEFDRVAEQVNAFAEVAHNYRRDHHLNMWFVVATETQAELANTLDKIEQTTAYPVYNMPKRDEFYVGLRFQL